MRQRVDDLHRQLEGRLRHLLDLVGANDAVLSRRAGHRAGAAEAGGRAGQALQAQGHVFDHARQVGAFAQALGETARLAGRHQVVRQRRQQIQ